MAKDKLKDTPRANTLENKIMSVAQDYYKSLGNMELSQKELDLIIYELVKDEDLVALVENIIDNLRSNGNIL